MTRYSELCNHIVIAMDPNFQHTRTWDIKVTIAYLQSTHTHLHTYLIIYVYEGDPVRGFAAPGLCGASWLSPVQLWKNPRHSAELQLQGKEVMIEVW